MTVRERVRSGTLTDSSDCFQLILTYRIPIRVEEAVFSPVGPERISTIDVQLGIAGTRIFSLLLHLWTVLGLAQL